MIGLNPIAIAGILIAATSLFMATLMFSIGNTNQNRIWGFFCSAVFVWGVSFYFIATTHEPVAARLWWVFSHIGVIFIPVLFIHFVYEFLGKKDRTVVLVAYLLGLIFLTADLTSHLFINNVQLVFNQFYYDTPPGLIYPEFFLFFQILIIYGHYLLYLGHQETKDPQIKRQIRLFFFATIVGFLGGGASFAPVFGLNIYPASILTVPLYPVIMGYAILRYRLFDLRVVTAQIMALVIFISTFVKLFTSTSFTDYLVNGITLVVALMLGGYLIRSVTDELRERELIERQEKELEIINAQQENILHFISHEIKGYLTKSEAAFSEIVQGDFGPVTPDLQSMATMALADVRRGVRTVIDILDAANLKKGTVSFKKDIFDMKDTVSQMVEHLKPDIDAKHLTIETSIAWEVPCKINGDETKVKNHIVRNLIDNAVKYTPSGTIKVTLVKADGVVRLTVKDSGVGITDEDKKRLFTEGGHGVDSIKVNVNSTGYGLYIAKQVTDAHGGKIWAESEGPGKGSSFIVELPAAS